MSTNSYVNGIGCVAASSDFESFFDTDFKFNDTDIVLKIDNPDYEKYFSKAVIRRMSKSLKIGTIAAIDALAEGNNPTPNAIITGTGMGSIENSEKFLHTLLQFNEQYLTPTAFVQSTQNVLGAHLALHLSSDVYNITYVQETLSFESALFDALLQQSTGESDCVLVGGVDETSPQTTKLYQLINHIKIENDTPQQYLPASTSGAVAGEGASFFVLENTQRENSYAQLLDVQLINRSDCIANDLNQFLKQNQLNLDDIDCMIVGLNNDAEFDHHYTELIDKATKNNTGVVYYKPLCGEYNTASAYAFWLANKVLKHQKIPIKLSVNEIIPQKIKYLLIYHQYRGKDYTFVLLKALN